LTSPYALTLAYFQDQERQKRETRYRNLVKHDFKAKRVIIPLIQKFKRIESHFNTTVTGSSLLYSTTMPVSFAPDASVALARSENIRSASPVPR